MEVEKGNRMKGSRIVALILLVVSGGSLIAPAWAAPQDQLPGPKMEAEAAFDGYFKYGEWLPVWVQLENSGPDLEAEVRVRVPGRSGATTFAAPVALPTGSRKLIPVYVLPNNFSHALEVELVADGQVLLAQDVPVEPQPNINYQVGLVAPERGALTLLMGVSLPGRERPKTLIDLSPADLPERVEGLHSFDTLILNDTDTSTLTPEQKKALEAWVRQGGHLVVGGGPGARRTAAGLPDELLPLVPQGELELESVSALAEFAGSEAVRVPGPFVAATGHEAEGRTLVAQDDLPLVRQRAVGTGRVDFVALDLATSPFDAWTGTTALWEELLAPGAAYPDWLPPDMSARQMKAGRMAYALSSLPALDLPSVRGLGLLLMLYIVIVGPVNYLVLRWRKRLHWAWVSVPLLTVVFSAGAFGMGYTLRGTDLILNKIAVIEVGSDRAAKITSYLGLFSPARQSYEIEVEDRSLLSPLTSDYTPWGPSTASTGGDIVFVQGEPSHVRGLAVNQWSMQTFMTEGVEPDFGEVEADLKFEDEALTGTIRNGTPYTLKDAVLVLGNHFVRLNELEPGHETPVTLELSNSTDHGLGQPLSYLLYEEQLRQSGLGGTPREAEIKRTVVEIVLDQRGGFSLTPSTNPWGSEGGTFRGLAFLGWSEEAPPDVEVAGRTPGQKTTALLYAPLSYHLPEKGDLSMPPGLIPGALVGLPIDGGSCGPSGASLWLGQGEAIFEFQVPEEARDIQVDEIKLIIETDGGGWWQPPDTAVYDWGRETWSALSDPVIGVNVVPDAATMVSDDGLVQVRLSADSNQGGCLYLELGLEGKR